MSNQQSKHFASWEFSKSVVERITGAISLIGVGIFLLLNSTGVVPWDAWGTVFLIFIRIWPIFLIFAGLQIMFGKNLGISAILNIAGTLVFLTILSLAAWLNIADNNIKRDLEKSFPLMFTLNQVINTEKISTTYTVLNNDYKNNLINTVNTKLNFTSEKFIITDNIKENILDLDAEYSKEYQEPYLRSELVDGSLNIESGNQHKNFIGFLNNPSTFKYNFGSMHQNKNNLDINMTSGEGEVRFEKLNLTNLSLHQTSGQFNADLSNIDPENISITLTSGDVELILSKDQNINLSYNKTSGDIKLNSKELEGRNGRVNITQGSTNTKTVNLSLNLTSGNITINTK